MTYYSTCRQLSFGRQNFGRPTTSKDTNVNLLQVKTQPYPVEETENLKNFESLDWRESGWKRFHHLLVDNNYGSEYCYFKNKSDFLKAVDLYLNNDYQKTKQFYKHLKALNKNDCEKNTVDTIKMMVDLLGRRVDLVSGLEKVLPNNVEIQMQKDAILIKTLGNKKVKTNVFIVENFGDFCHPSHPKSYTLGRF